MSCCNNINHHTNYNLPHENVPITTTKRKRDLSLEIDI